MHDDDDPPEPEATTHAKPAWPTGALDATYRRAKAVLTWTDPVGAREAVITEPTSVGSAANVAVSIADVAVSRLHFEAAPAADGVWITDLGSRNGTFYEGARVKCVCVPDGARVRVGGTEVRVRLVHEGQDAALFPAAQLGPLVGGSAVMRELFAQLVKVAQADETALIHGETGTGKELVARAIHDHSRRSEGPFVVVDCGALPENLLDAELFGHTKGAFTGAHRDRRGAFQEADCGTLFLDEIGELPLSVQPRLLRAIESRMVRRLGESAYRNVDLRFVCATHRDLRAMVNAGTFREDLYFRLAVLQLNVPPLRARRDDVPRLLTRFLPDELARYLLVSPQMVQELMARPWGGNVRELRNFAGRVKALGWSAAMDGAPSDARATATDGAPVAQSAASDGPGAFPGEVLEGPYRDARETVLASWGYEYVKALGERHGGDRRKMAAEAGVNTSYLWKLGKR